MFDINMYDLSDVPNKVTYCNWRTEMVFNDTENYKLSHNQNIFNFTSTRPGATIERHSNSPPTFPIATGEWATAKRTPCQWSKADWQLIKEQTVIFAKQYLALALTRTVKENHTVFIEYMEGILAINIPLKFSNSLHNLPWMNRGSNDNSLQVVELSGLQTCKLLSTHPSKPFLRRFSGPESVCSG